MTRESLFTDAREALDALANGAAGHDDGQGLDTVQSLAVDVEKALNAAEVMRAALVEIAAIPGRSVPSIIAQRALDGQR